MNYGKFAYLYDRLMMDAPYDEWIHFTTKMVKQYCPEATEVLDVGCGTGELLIRLHQSGFSVTGVDLSADMLTIAQNKLSQAKIESSLLQQDMRKLSGLSSFDVITVYCDSLNYLANEAEISSAFQSFYTVLRTGGLLLFDVHSIYKIVQKYIGETFADETEELAYIWNVFEGSYNYSVEHELTFFMKDNPTGLYERFEEVHFQRTFPVKVYQKLLENAGFEVEACLGDFGSPLTEVSERIFFVAKKKDYE